MLIVLARHALRPEYTIGKLYIDGYFQCNTLEDTDRELFVGMQLKEIKARKVYGRTAIPYGTYEVDMDTVSPKYKTKAAFKELTHGGKMPRLKSVPGWDGVLIHSGNTAEDSLGCILVGNNSVVGKLTDSMVAFKKVYKILDEAHQRGEKITLRIERR